MGDTAVESGEKKTKRQIAEERSIADAKRAFETHKIVSFEKTPGIDHLGRWLLRREDGKPWSWVEIVELRGGGLLVHGDIKHTFFSLHPSKNDRVGSLVAWMGNRKNPCSYFRSKLETCSSSHDPGMKWDAEIADEDARIWNAERLGELRAELCGGDDEENEGDEGGISEDEDGEGDEITEVINDGVSSNDDASEQRRRWYEAGIDSEGFARWGMVLDYNTALAWAALARLTTLLREEAAAADKALRDSGAGNE